MKFSNPPVVSEVEAERIALSIRAEFPRFHDHVLLQAARLQLRYGQDARTVMTKRQARRFDNIMLKGGAVPAYKCVAWGKFMGSWRSLESRQY